MTDEEKNAIDDLKEVVDLYNDKCLITTEDDFKSIEILLNLIEKQSKEIERLEKKIKRYEKIIEHKDEKCEQLLEFVETEKETDYISKDKIKAIIEEIKSRKIANEEIKQAIIVLLQSLLEKE